MRAGMYAGTDDPADPDPEQDHRPSRWELPGLVLALALTGVVLHRLGGWPHHPAARPDPRDILSFLKGSDLPPLDAIRDWCLAAAWALWLWLGASVLVQGALALLDAVTRGAAWVRALRPVLDRVTAGVARRAVTGATVGLLVVQLARSTTAGVGAAPAPEPIVRIVAAPGDETTTSLAHRSQREGTERRIVEHTIVEGDTLLGVARRYYGTEEEYPRLVAANQGR